MAVTISGSGVVTGLDSEASSDLGSKLEAAGGLVMVTPTTIANSGGTATLTDGAVEFSGVSSVSLNGCFTSAYDNYVINSSLTGTAGTELRLRFRATGTDNTANNYFWQYLIGESTTAAGQREQNVSNSQISYVRSGDVSLTMQLFNPQLSAITRGTVQATDTDTSLRHYAIRHSTTNSFDGITFYVSSGTITGTIRVYGYRNGI